jgi:hypothetical protein
MDELQRISPDTLRMERLLDAPVEKVWRWLVEPELRALWFAGGTAADRPGEFELHFDHDRLSSNAPALSARIPGKQGSQGRRAGAASGGPAPAELQLGRRLGAGFLGPA